MHALPFLSRTALVALLGSALVLCAAPPPAKPSAEPRSPDEERATFQLLPGFHAELVACEPAVVDPVAMAFDEEGRIYVAEMPGYPNGGVATGQISSGRIRLLEDRDGDGFYEKATMYAEGLRFPTGLMPWKGGLIVANAPDLVYFEDTDGDGRADRHRVLYTGFGLTNIQQLVNSPQWALDNWVYACAGINPSEVRSVERPETPGVTLRSRGVRFHPEKPGSLEPMSGGGQYGLAADDWEQWFTNTNNQHLRHIVLPDHYLRRNPALTVGEVTLDIPDHGAACQVHRISAFESWRVERTRRRREGPDARRFPSTELVPGGYITSACSPVVYTADLFPPAFRGNTLICDPANNLIHRDILEPHGATFVARRADAEREFLASTDNWFRPVYLTIGPDAAVYVLDFYREVIETPLSLPEDIKRAVNLQSRGRGRIWRIVPDGYQRGKRPALRAAATSELVRHLADANPWWRLTAQRLLMERQDRSAIQPLHELARTASTAPGRAHALWALHGLHDLQDKEVLRALTDSEAGVRMQGLRLAEERLRASAQLQEAVSKLADDPSAQVRFQLAFTLGEADTPVALAALGRVARRDVSDPWTQTAVLSSAARTAPSLLDSLACDPAFTEHAGADRLTFLGRLASLVGARATDAELVRVLTLLVPRGDPAPWQSAVLGGLGQGLQNSGRPLAGLWERGPAALREALERTRSLFERAAATARDDQKEPGLRAEAVRLLGHGPFALAAATLPTLLQPQFPAELQLAAVRALSLQESPQVAALLLAGWGSYSPAVRREVVEALFARHERLPQLLGALEEHKVLAGQLDPFRVAQLRKLADAGLRARAEAVLAGQGTPDRQKVVEAYRPALDLKGDAARGRDVFRKTCATCHRLENFGVEVGPDLLSALKTKTREGLLVDLFDPSREVDARYLNYVVTSKAGRVFTGMIAAETSGSVTLRRAERAEDTVLRSQIEEIQATTKSLMPENLETQLSKQDAADVIAYLLTVAGVR
jgi:putative membrane-bound dehydrogenase-like protein